MPKNTNIKQYEKLCKQNNKNSYFIFDLHNYTTYIQLYTTPKYYIKN